MQNNKPIEDILKKRSFQKTDLNALNSKIINLAKNSSQNEFQVSTIRVNNNVKIISIAACFILGLFAGFNLELDTISSDFANYVYIEEGIV